MDSLTIQLRERRDSMAVELNHIRHKLDELTAKAEVLTKQIAACDVLLGPDEAPRQKWTRISVQPTEGDGTGTLFQPPQTDAEVAIDVANKTESVFGLLRATGPGGATSTELFQKAARHGVVMPRNYIYNILGRLKDRGRVTQDGEKYYAVAS